MIWELYNEPNIHFWEPQPNVSEYIALAQAVGHEIRAYEPDEWFIGPAVSGMDWNFLEACMKAGLLQYWDAVSVHPYRQSAPETAAKDYRELRTLIARYAPKGKQIPILSAIEARVTARQIMDAARMDHGGSRVPDALAIAAWEHLTSNHG